MSSTIETLRRMADDIAKNFEAMGHGNAVLATADHIQKFWDPRMRQMIYADDHSTLTPTAREAVAAPQGRRPPRNRRPARPSSTRSTRAAGRMLGESPLPARLREGVGGGPA